MASNTTYIPEGTNLDPSRVQGAGQGVTAVCAALGTTNIDLAITDDSILTGVQLITVGATPGDSLTLQVLAGGTPILTPISNWYVSATGDVLFDLAMPVKVITGLTLRIVVTTTVLLVTPRVSVNYKLWKVLP